MDRDAGGRMRHVACEVILNWICRGLLGSLLFFPVVLLGWAVGLHGFVWLV